MRKLLGVCILLFLLTFFVIAADGDAPESSGLVPTTDSVNDESLTDTESMQDVNRYTPMGLISRETVYNDDGSERYTDYFRYTRSKRLRSIERVYPDGTKEKTSILSSSGRLHSLFVASHKKEDAHLRIFSYDNESRVASEHHYKENERKSLRTYSYAVGTKNPFGSVTIENDATEFHVYDDNGKIIKRERKNTDGKLIEETVFEYTESGIVSVCKLTEYTWQVPTEKTFELKLTPDVTVSVYQYEYDEDDNLIKETYSVNKKICRIIEYENNMVITDAHYQDGTLFLKVYYNDNKKVKEELYRGEIMTGIRIFE